MINTRTKWLIVAVKNPVVNNVNNPAENRFINNIVEIQGSEITEKFIREFIQQHNCVIINIIQL
jgi:hypothetical protein